MLTDETNLSVSPWTVAAAPFYFQQDLGRLLIIMYYLLLKIMQDSIFNVYKGVPWSLVFSKLHCKAGTTSSK